MPKRITIKDLARELKVHHSTVSRALRNDPRVNEETKKLVIEAAQLHGYQINMNALHLRGATNNIFALIVPNIRHTFFTNVVSYLTNLAHKKGFVVSIFESNEEFEQEKETINTIIKYNFSGVIASIARNTMNGEHFKLLRNYGIPLVFFDRVCEDIDTPKVMVKNYEAAFNAVELLIKKGYRKIAHITGPLHLNVFRDRYKGYLGALSEHGLAYQNYLIIDKEFVVDEGKSGFLHLLEQGETPDAILSTSSLLSIGIMMKAKELGFVIPENLALIGFGDNQFTDILEPGITSIIQPEEEIAETCFELMLKLINKELDIDYPLTKEINARMLYRESV